MMNMAKKLQAILAASVLAVSTLVLSIVPASQTEAAVLRRPSQCEVEITSTDYQAGGTISIIPTYQGEVDSITYEFYNTYYRYPYRYGYNGYWDYYFYQNEVNKSYKEFKLTPEDIESGVETTFDIPEDARGVYAVRAVYTNKAGNTVASLPYLLTIKNANFATGSYVPSYYRYYGNVPSYYYNNYYNGSNYPYYLFYNYR